MVCRPFLHTSYLFSYEANSNYIKRLRHVICYTIYNVPLFAVKNVFYFNSSQYSRVKVATV